jgi:hypothetical protein
MRIVIRRVDRMLPWAAITLLLLVRTAGGADWPQLQGDAGHTGYTDEDIGRLFSEGWPASVRPTAFDAAAGDIAPLDNDGRLDGTYGDQAFLISDGGWILSRAGGALYVTSWHGIYGLDLDTQALFPVLLASHAQPSDVMDAASIVLFDEHVAASHEGGDGRPGAISDGSMYYLAGNTLVAMGKRPTGR